jgi:hypothetical protein
MSWKNVFKLWEEIREEESSEEISEVKSLDPSFSSKKE